ncbi:MAG: hypothetical protein KBS70_06935 [Bacteroidales bacterium]|nr:hypothetical protein [Candidatus Colicola equi]
MKKFVEKKCGDFKYYVSTTTDTTDTTTKQKVLDYLDQKKKEVTQRILKGQGTFASYDVLIELCKMMGNVSYLLS